MTNKMPMIKASAPSKESGEMVFTSSAPLEVLAASQEGGAKKFKILAYTGGKMDVGWGDPIVVDLSGMEVSAKPRPILKDHNTSLVVGHSTSIKVKNEIEVEGLFSGSGPAKDEVLASAVQGFPWQASIGAKAIRVEELDSGAKAKVNGQEIEGPCFIVRASILKEVSFVALGADDNTSAIAANQHANHQKGVATMDKFTEWLIKAGFIKAESDLSSLTAALKDSLKVQFEASEKAKTVTAPAPTTQVTAADFSKDIMAEFGVSHPDIAAEAIEKGWDMKATRLAVVRANQPKAPNVITAKENDSDKFAKHLEIAAGISAGMQKQIEKSETPEDIEAATKRFKNISLQEMIIEGAVRNGYAGRRSMRGNFEEIFRAAFSDLSLPKIFGNVANKKLLSSFMEVEQVWRQIVVINSVPDFRPTSSLRMTADFKFERVTDAGELKHAKSPTETEYTNQANTFGKMYAITRKDIINDDLNVLSSIPAHIGRGAGLKLNEDFWTLFLNNSSKFTSGNKNYQSGAGTVLGIDGLTTAEQLFLDMVDDGGYPLGQQSNILLVPTALKSKANQLMNSTEIRDTTASTKFGTANPHAGKWTVVTSPYMSNSKFTGYSSTAWYLLGTNSMLPLIEAVFLNGQETPTIESAEADFSTLGIQMRGYFDFGFAWQDVRGAVKSAGA
jgi:phage major head subunit gpT-like protein